MLPRGRAPPARERATRRPPREGARLLGRRPCAVARAHAEGGARILLWSAAGRGEPAPRPASRSRASPTAGRGRPRGRRRGRHRLDQGLGPAAAARRPELPRALDRGRASRSGGSRSCTSTTPRGSPAARARRSRRCSRVLEAERPDEVEAVGLAAGEALLLARACTARGVLFHGPPPAPRRGGGRWSASSLRSRWNTAEDAAGRGQGARSPAAPAAPAARPAHACSSSPTPRSGGEREAGDGAAAEPYEHYFDRLIPGIARDGRRCSRSWWRSGRAPPSAAGARASGWREWLALAGGDGRFVHMNRFTTRGVRARGRRAATRRSARRVAAAARRARRCRRPSRTAACAFARPGRGATWRARCCCSFPGRCAAYEEMRGGAAPRAAGRGLPLRGVERLGPGRAGRLRAPRACPAWPSSTASSTRTTTPTATTPTRRSCPRPDRTAVFGEAAERFLVEARPLPARVLVRHGQPQVRRAARRARARWDRARAARAALGVARDESLVVVASRFRAIREHAPVDRQRLPRAAARGAKPCPACAAWSSRTRRSRPRAYEAALRAAGARAHARAAAGGRPAGAAARRRRAGDGGVALRGGGAGAGPARGGAEHAHQPARAGGGGGGLGVPAGEDPAGRRCGACSATRRRASASRRRARATSPSWPWAWTAAPPRASWPCSRRRLGRLGRAGRLVVRGRHGSF